MMETKLRSTMGSSRVCEQSLTPTSTFEVTVTLIDLAERTLRLESNMERLLETSLLERKILGIVL